METNIIYLMGAGRSGTTALATFLGNNKNITTVGEMHQFFEHLAKNKKCSCSQNLDTCEFWSEIIKELPSEFINKPDKLEKFCEKFEYHTAIVKYSMKKFNSTELNRYISINESIFKTIKEKKNTKYILDSAKYIGRYLGLQKSKDLNIKTIYVIRDIRGVISSFSKSVQSPRKPLSTIVYWLIVNSVGEFLYRTSPRGSMIKVTYENLIDHPIKEFERLEKFLEIDLSDIKDKIKNNNSFLMPHIIGGNRMKSNKEIKFQQDISWRVKYGFLKKIFYYLLASPIMLINRFKI